MRIHLLSLDGLGDLVLRQPLVSALLDAGHEVTIVVRESWAPMVACLDKRARAWGVDLSPYRPPDHHEWRRVRTLLEELRRSRTDALVDASFDRTAVGDWLLRSIGRTTRCGFEDASRPGTSVAALDVPVRCEASLPEAEKYRLLHRALCAGQPPLSAPSLSPGASATAAATAWLAQRGLAAGTYVTAGLAGLAGPRAWAWPLERYAAVLAGLECTHGLRLLLTGSHDDAHALDVVSHAISAKGGHPITWTGGPAELPAWLALLSAARAYVGADTATMHCSALLGVPFVAWFGGGTWPRYVPTVGAGVAVAQALPCFGCHWECWAPRPACLDLIPAEAVATAVDDVLGGHVRGVDVRLQPFTGDTEAALARSIADAGHGSALPRALDGWRVLASRHRQAIVESSERELMLHDLTDAIEGPRGLWRFAHHQAGRLLNALRRGREE